MSTLKKILADLASLRNPVTSAAIVATVVEVANSLGATVPSAALAGIFGAVGVVAYFVEKQLGA